jgi:hypothetical protein
MDDLADPFTQYECCDCLASAIGWDSDDGVCLDPGFADAFGDDGSDSDSDSDEALAPPIDIPAAKPAEPAKPAGPAPDRGLFRQVIDQQDIGGWWPAADPLLAIVHATLPPLPEVAARAKANEIVATIVALAILRKRCGSDQGVWKLIEKKAVAWLRGEGVDFEPLIARVAGSLAD